MKKIQDFTDVPLVLEDDQTFDAHKVMLTASSDGKPVDFSEPENLEMLQPMELSQKWMEGTTIELPHYLREDKIDATARTNAMMETHFVTKLKNGGKCAVIQFSTGCYYNVCVPLIRGWVTMLGDPAKLFDGFKIEVKEVCGSWVKDGAIQSYKVNLVVDNALCEKPF